MSNPYTAPGSDVTPTSASAEGSALLSRKPRFPKSLALFFVISIPLAICAVFLIAVLLAGITQLAAQPVDAVETKAVTALSIVAIVSVLLLAPLALATRAVVRAVRPGFRAIIVAGVVASMGGIFAYTFLASSWCHAAPPFADRHCHTWAPFWSHIH